MFEQTPGGMSVSSWDKFNKHIDFNAFHRLGYTDTKWGVVYLAERFNGSDWTILWAARDMFCKLECKRWSSQKARKQAAVNHAFHHLVERETVFKEL